MNSSLNPNVQWDSSFRLVASEKWKAKSAAMGHNVTEALVEYSQPKPGMNVLDLASGTGEPAISVAALLNASGKVIALDLNAELLEIASERAHQRKLTNFSTCQANAQCLPFPDNSFDLVTCRFGVMFMGEPALQEAHRVLKSGGRACFAAWGPFEQPYWSSNMGVVHKYVGGPPVLETRDPFKYSQPGSLSTALRHAGFEVVQEETKTLPWTWPGTAEEVWDYIRSVSVPFHPMLERVPPERWDTIHHEILAEIGKYVEDGSVKFGATIVLASGTK